MQSRRIFMLYAKRKQKKKTEQKKRNETKIENRF